MPRELTAERLRELLDYDPETGVFTWRVRAAQVIRIGDIAGVVDYQGYRRIQVGGHMRAAHRLAWLYVHGRWPADQIDHINGIKDDNRIANLREATHAENQQNQRRARISNRSSGLIGASWSKWHAKWGAGITLNRKRRHLGYFDTAEEAHAAYIAAKGKAHPFNTLEVEPCQEL